jgi:guanyl-specific ribonuclease Sa
VDHAHEHGRAGPARSDGAASAQGQVRPAAAARPMAGLLRDTAISRTSAPTVRRAILAALPAEPSYKDGLTMDTIVSTAVDKPVKPTKAKDVKKTMKKKYGADETTWPTEGAAFLQNGEVHGNQVYENKDSQLPPGSYKEYDIAKYAGVARGTDRVVCGQAGGNPGTTYYFTGDHYQNFSPFTPGGAKPATVPAQAVAAPVAAPKSWANITAGKK